MKSRGLYLATGADRIWHWIHALGVLGLIVSGFNIHFLRYFNPLGSFETAVRVHNIIGLIVTFDWGLWLFYNLFSGRIRYYAPDKNDLPRGMLWQAKYYLYGIFNQSPNPFPVSHWRKFNPLQKWTYLGIMLILIPVEIVTGLYMLYMIKGWGNFVGSELKVISILHTIGAFCATAFLGGHLYLATTGRKPFSHYLFMITGYHEHETDE
jgi:thiosulfate reductase cytochrome b subunit